MARAIPVISRKALEASSTGDAVVCFVKITHPLIETPIRLVVDGVDYMIGDEIWHSSAFELELLSDDENPPSAPFRFPNVDRRAIAMLADATGPIRVDFDLYSSSYFDLGVEPRVVKPGLTLERLYRAPALRLTDVSADEVMVEGTLRSWDFRQEQWPGLIVTEALLPGVFAT